MARGFALERQNQFLSEKRGPHVDTCRHGVQVRTELYKRYYSGASQMKIGYGAKNPSQWRALLGIERGGA